MSSHPNRISRGLILLLFVSCFHVSTTRYVKPITFGYELGSPFNEILPVASDLDADLSISAAEPRPVFVELVKRPLSLPLVSNVGASARSEAPVLSASEKIEKILRRPMAFSYNSDLTNAASDLIINSPKERLQTVESKHRLDQQPDAIDYYKYIARLQGEDKEGGVAVQKDNTEQKKEENNSEKEEVAKDETTKADLRRKSRPNLFLSYSPSSFHHEYSQQDHQPAVEYQKSQQHETPEEKSEEKQESKKDDQEDHQQHHEHQHHHHHQEHQEAQPEAGNKAEASESHEEQKEESHHNEQGGQSEGHKQEEVQASASHHGGGGGGGGGGGNYKKGGGKEFQSVHHGEHGEHGEKKYSGHHHHEKGDKGHKDKDGHKHEYDEEEGHKHGHHDEDGYEAEHHHGEDGKRGTEFHEEGEHSKGHSTQGEHNIHKKDEFEKKQEFYDESHEGGEHEKHGEYFHEDDYHKGGHHKSEHKHGGEHEEHYGKKKEFAEGGHEHEDKGHKKAIGHDVHHDHQEKKGEEKKHDGGKKWHSKHESGNGGGDNKGAHQTVQVVVQEKDGKDGKAEASTDAKAEDSKGADYRVHEINTEKKNEADDQGGHHYDHGHHQAEATEEHRGHEGHHGGHEHEAYGHGSHEGLDVHHGHGEGHEHSDAGHHYGDGHKSTEGHPAQLQSEGVQVQEEPQHNYGADIYPHIYGVEAIPQNTEEQPTKPLKNSYGNDVTYITHGLAHEALPLESHVHANGHICPGSLLAAHTATEKAEKISLLESAPANESRGEESAPKSHILVVGSDGNIYGVLANDKRAV